MKFNTFAASLMAMGAALLPAVIASPANAKGLGLDFEGIENKVRSGAIAVANSDQPFDERSSRVAYRNGDIIDASLVGADSVLLAERQLQSGELSMKSCSDACDDDDISGTCTRVLGCFEVVSVPW
jgi:hypothetical protein